jgi:pyruvate kinase
VHGALYGCICVLVSYSIICERQDVLSYDSSVLDKDQDVRATLLDTRGPEIRTGKLAHDDSGHETISLNKGDLMRLQTAPKWEQEGSTDTDLFINYAKLNECMKPGMKVLLDDGAVIMTVTDVEAGEYGVVTCSIDNPGEIRSRAGVNLPMAETDLPAMSDKDRTDIKYGMTIDVDYLAASFIQNAEAVREIRTYMEGCAKELGWDVDRPLPKIISKIESASALVNFDEILAESDGIMVARGDLGVEIPIQQVTNAQKEMVAACNAVGKPVIVATQMLESMAKNPRPTRAEVSDVTNACYDGADAVMTSGETAKGKYPEETIKTMNEIIQCAEQYGASGHLGSLYVQHGGDKSLYLGNNGHAMDAAIAKAAVTASLKGLCEAILVITEKGTLPQMVAAYRPNCPVVTFCPNKKMARQLILNRGIYPVVGLQSVAESDKPAAAIKEAASMGFVKPGDSVVILHVDRTESTRSANFTISTVPE